MKIPEMTDQQILQACVAYYNAKGKYPTATSGDSYAWTKVHILWNGIDQRLWKNPEYRGLRGFLLAHGLK